MVRPIAPIQASFSVEDTVQKNNVRPQISTLSALSFFTSSSADFTTEHCLKERFSVAESLVLSVLKVIKVSLVRTIHRFRHSLRNRLLFSTHPCLIIPSGSIYDLYSVDII